MRHKRAVGSKTEEQILHFDIIQWLQLPCRPTLAIMSLTNVTNLVNATMRAVLWEGNAYNVSVADVPRPSIINATDAIVKISRAGICGSDLHVYRGTQDGPETPFILGHEGIGYVSEIGDGVGSLAIGDPVVIPFSLAEGHIHTGLTTQMYGGYGNGGDIGGTQGKPLSIICPSIYLLIR